ncbi:hypothetical protein AA15669_0696 [Saccharibacter floricola DSM 15669]|uniref:Uncharacterized protein n=1 Tax=Saccharibacter floricola DSM 15669 TaxID=1123227 RepID=A0ABQ0NXL2_9PROT|nr:hypothetical protein AA15669_0696 [Saccharibacter floricola DSM 15669]
MRYGGDETLNISISCPFNIVFDVKDYEDIYGSLNFDIHLEDKEVSYEVSFFRNDWISYKDYDLFVYNLKSFKDSELINLDQEIIFSIKDKKINFLAKKFTEENEMYISLEYKGNIDYRYNIIESFSSFPKWW